MKNTKLNTPTQSVDEGWSIHFYDRERRLRCTIEPSHGRALGLGVVLGVLITLVVTNLRLPIAFETASGSSSQRSLDAIEETHLPAPLQME